MRRHPLPSRRASRRAAGFTLSEVLIALGILAVGSVSVASLFPAGLLLQKQTVDEAIRQNHTRSMDALLLGNGLDNNVLFSFTEMVGQNTSTAHSPARIPRNASNTKDMSFDVFALAEVDQRLGNPTASPPTNNIATGVSTTMLGPTYGGVNATTTDAKYRANESYLAQFPLSIRTLPTITPPAGVGAGSAFAPDPDYSLREVFWVPLIRRGLEASDIFGDWSVYVFVLQPDPELREQGAYFLNPVSPSSDAYADGWNNLVCANPFDPAYFPKVFRMPVAWNASNPNVATAPAGFNLFGLVKPGDMVLGDNGKIYKVATVTNSNPSQITLNSQTAYEPINERDLTALWVAPATNPSQSSPVADIRLMSNAVVRVDPS